MVCGLGSSAWDVYLEAGVAPRAASTTVLQELTQTARTPVQRASQVGCDLAAQGGDGMRIMPFRSNRQSHGASRRGAGEVGCRLHVAVVSRARGKKGIA